jgi:prepilin-type N-terminal cleavage/methylation domain-containing protein
MKLHHSPKGFSLLEMLIGLGLLGGIILIAMGLIDYFRNGQSEMSSSMAARDLMGEIRGNLSRPDLCKLNFDNLSVNSAPLNINDIKKGSTASPVVQFAKNTSYYDKHLEILEMNLRDYLPLTSTDGKMELAIRLKKLRSKGTTGESYQAIPVIVKLDNPTDRRIISCYALGGGTGAMGKDVCEGMGGQFFTGATKAQNQCLWPQVTVSKSSTLTPSNSTMLHVQADSNSDGIFEDVLLTMTNGASYVNYALSGPPPSDAGTSLFVNGDERVSGDVSSDKIMTEHLSAVPAADHSTFLTYPTDKWFRLKNANGEAGGGEWFGNLWFDGGADGVSVIANTGESINGGTIFARKFSWVAPTTFPAAGPVNDPYLTLYNNGKVGVGYSILATDPYPLPLAASFPNVKLFVRESARIFGRTHIAGNLSQNYAGYTSDRRFKKNIKPLGPVRPGLAAIDGVSYQWKFSRDHLKNSDIGFIAQDVEEYFPEVVHTDQAGHKTMEYSKLMPVLWEAVKEKQRKNQEQRSRVENLKKVICPKYPQQKLCRQYLDSIKVTTSHSAAKRPKKDI